jgi:acetylornithine/N-succinyldiaminopimelate aminotransferase
MYIMPTNHRPDLVMVRGAGSWLFDDQGRRYLDFVQGWAVNALGHCADEVCQALAEQSRTLVTPSPAYHNDPACALAERLALAAGLDRVFLSSSGAEANECALKLARKWGRLHKAGAHEVVTTHNSFHGRTLSLMSASGKPGWEQMFPPRVEGFVKVPYGDIAAMRAAVTDRTAAILVEPIQGEAGVIVPPSGYLGQLRALADATGTLLVFDEIQTGMGRTGTLFRFQSEDARPDVLVLGKGLGGGVPLAAVVATLAASCFEPGEHGGTYAGNPLMAAVGRAVFDVVAHPSFLAAVAARGALLHSALQELRGERPDLLAEVRGAGLLAAIGLHEPVAEDIVLRARAGGLLLNAARPNTLRLMPSLRVSEAEIAEMTARLRAALP